MDGPYDFIAKFAIVYNYLYVLEIDSTYFASSANYIFDR